MPSPKPSRSVSLRDFDGGGTWKPRRKAASGHPPRAKQLVELLTLGPLAGGPAMTLPEAAAAMGIKIGTARAYLHMPASRQLFMALCTSIREGEIPANLRVAAQIRDDPTLSSAAGARAKIEAARYLERGGDKAQGTTINLGMAIGVTGGNIAPGYAVTLSAEHVQGARKLLKAAGSKRNLLEDEATDAVVIEQEAPPVRRARSTPVTDTDEGPEPVAVRQRHDLQWGRAPDELYPPGDSRHRAPPPSPPIADALES
jgi:hypothetical protein